MGILIAILVWTILTLLLIGGCMAASFLFWRLFNRLAGCDCPKKP